MRHRHKRLRLHEIIPDTGELSKREPRTHLRLIYSGSYTYSTSAGLTPLIINSCKKNPQTLHIDRSNKIRVHIYAMLRCAKTHLKSNLHRCISERKQKLILPCQVLFTNRRCMSTVTKLKRSLLSWPAS